MKNKLQLSLVFLSLLSLASCGKSVDKVVKQMGKDIGNQLNCGLAESGTELGSTLAQDYDVKMYKKTIELVLADLSSVKNLEPSDFWAYLAEDTRNILNYELNIIQLKKPLTDKIVLYQAVAYFFTEVKDSFKDGIDYKFKSTENILFSFTARAQATPKTELLNTKCGKYEKINLGLITINPEVIKIENVREVYECRTLTEAFTLMDAKEALLFKSKKGIRRLKSARFIKDNKARSLKLSYETREASFEILIKKKQDYEIKDWRGKKASIEFKSYDFNLDEKGACNSLIRGFEQ